jgi:CDP-diacylglycerol--glycerol-3-phosphate 3-phosphatidyltransferase
MAHALTALRLLLVVPFGILMAAGTQRSAIYAALIFATAIVTDLLDGRIARRTGSASSLGGAFDHSTDFLFVMSGLVGGVSRGAFPWVLPIVIAVAFGQYVVDSYWLHGYRQLRKSQLGRYNGILYFVPLGGDILLHLGFGFVQLLLQPIAWLLVLSTLISIGQRLTGIRNLRPRDPASPAEGRASQSWR